MFCSHSLWHKVGLFAHLTRVLVVVDMVGQGTVVRGIVVTVWVGIGDLAKVFCLFQEVGHDVSLELLGL